MGKRILVAVLGVLGGSMAAYAESVTYDFTGNTGASPRIFFAALSCLASSGISFMSAST
jgi:hypothetical protein